MRESQSNRARRKKLQLERAILRHARQIPGWADLASATSLSPIPPTDESRAARREPDPNGDHGQRERRRTTRRMRSRASTRYGDTASLQPSQRILRRDASARERFVRYHRLPQYPRNRRAGGNRVPLQWRRKLLGRRLSGGNPILS